MVPEKVRIPIRELVRMRNYERVFSFLSREGGLELFFGEAEATNTNTKTPRDRIRDTLARCFGDTTAGRNFARRALAANHAHALRRLTDANGTKKAPLDEMVSRLSELRTLGVGTYEKMEAACSAVAAAFVCELYQKFGKADLRICAFIRSLEKLPKSSSLPSRFYEIGDKARMLKEGAAEISQVDEQLVELAKQHTQGIAVTKVSDLLDALALDHTWHERMDQIEQDVESGVLVYYDKLRQRGLALINRGDWVRNESPRTGAAGKKKANKGQTTAEPEGKRPRSRQRKSPIVGNDVDDDEDRIMGADEAPQNLQISNSKRSTPCKSEVTLKKEDIVDDKNGKLSAEKERGNNCENKVWIRERRNGKQVAEVEYESIEKAMNGKSGSQYTNGPSGKKRESWRKSSRRGRNEAKYDVEEVEVDESRKSNIDDHDDDEVDRAINHESNMRCTNGSSELKQRSERKKRMVRKAPSHRRHEIELDIEGVDESEDQSEDEGVTRQNLHRKHKSVLKKQQKNSKRKRQRAVAKVEDEMEEIDKIDEMEDVLAVMRMNSAYRGRKRRAMMESSDERHGSGERGETRSKVGLLMKVRRNVTTPVKRRRFSLDTRDTKGMTRDQMEWIERFAVEETTQVSMSNIENLL